MILASGSPRRRQLLAEAGYIFDTVASLPIDESYPADLLLDRVAVYLAEKKNRAYRNELNSGVIITADTTVFCEGRLLEKAADATEAFAMLQALSGRVHEVITGICVSDDKKAKSLSVVTEVHFSDLDEGEIDYYISKFQPFDKAGAYGIQEWIGMIGIKKIVGSYYNVVGLPLFELYQLLKNDFGITPQ
jgi:septum formation protein